MASIAYFTNSTPGFTPSGFQGSWTLTGSAVTNALSADPAGAATTVQANKTTSTNPSNICWGRWVSGAAVNDGTLSGTVSWVVGVRESATTANAFMRVHIYVTVGSSDTVRGTLLSNFTDTVEFTTTATGQTRTVTGTATDVAISSVNVVAGDLIVVEIGWQGQTTLTSVNATMDYGNTGAFRLLHGDTVTTTKPGWIQFSDPNQVLRPTYAFRRNLCVNPTAAVDTTPWDWSGNQTVTAGSVSGFSRSTAVHAVITATGSLFISGPTTPTAAGEVWSQSVEVACSASRAATVFLRFKDAAGVALTAPAQQDITYSPTVQRITFNSATAPSNAAFTYITCNSSALAVNDTVDMSCVFYDRALALPEYSDGDTGGWVWDGTPGKSTSHELLGIPLLRSHCRGPNYRR